MVDLHAAREVGGDAQRDHPEREPGRATSDEPVGAQQIGGATLRHLGLRRDVRCGRRRLALIEPIADDLEHLRGALAIGELARGCGACEHVVEAGQQLARAQQSARIVVDRVGLEVRVGEMQRACTSGSSPSKS